MAHPARAQERLTLAAAVSFAIGHNPDLAMARTRADSAVAEVRIARSYPNPQLQATPGLPSTYSIALPLDVGPQRHYRVISQRQGASAAAQDSSDIRRQLLFAVRQAYCDAELSVALYSIAGEQREIVRQVLAADSARLRAGAIPLRDVVKSTVELSRADAAVARASASSRATRVTLQIVMGIANLIQDSFCRTRDTASQAICYKRRARDGGTCLRFRMDTVSAPRFLHRLRVRGYRSDHLSEETVFEERRP